MCIRDRDYQPSEILIGAGAISLLNLACTAMLDIGDEVLLPDPGWANYKGQRNTDVILGQFIFLSLRCNLGHRLHGFHRILAVCRFRCV